MARRHNTFDLGLKSIGTARKPASEGLFEVVWTSFWASTAVFAPRRLMAAESRFSSVVELCSEALANRPDAEAHLLRARARHALKEVDAAREDLTAAIRLGAEGRQLEDLKRALRRSEAVVRRRRLGNAAFGDVWSELRAI